MVLPISEKNNMQSKQTESSEQKKPTGSFKRHLNPLPPPPQKRHSSVFDLSKQQPRKREKEKTSTPHVHGQQRTENKAISSETKVSETYELSAEMIELSQKLGDFIVMESKKGISTVEITVNLENSDSLFNKTVVQIQCYDTAPFSFNIELSHSLESAVTQLSAELPSLMKALQTRLENFQINLLPPSFSKEKPTSKVEKTREEKKVDNLKKSLHNWNKKD